MRVDEADAPADDAAAPLPEAAPRARSTSRPRAAAAPRAAGDAELEGAAAGWGENKCSLAREGTSKKEALPFFLYKTLQDH